MKNRRSKKISCRLTEEERQKGLDYCKKYGINEAKLLRASYLAALSQVPDQMNGVAEKLLNSLEEIDLPIRKKWILKSNMKEILKRVSLLLVIIFVATSLATSPTVAKYFLYIMDSTVGLFTHAGYGYIHHEGDKGFELVPVK